MNNQTNRLVKAKKLFVLLTLFGIVGFVVFPSWTRLRSEDKIISAQRQAEVLGYQVFEIYREATTETATLVRESSSRAPSSVGPTEQDLLGRRESGSIGGDPWGQPYRYKILTASKDHLKVQIWSAGPNKTFETNDKPGFAAEHYDGDDVGIVLSMAPKSIENQ